MRVLQGLLSLAKRHRGGRLEKACAIAVSYDSYRLRTIRTLLKREGAKQQELTFHGRASADSQPGDYGQLVRQAFHKEAE